MNIQGRPVALPRSWRGSLDERQQVRTELRIQNSAMEDGERYLVELSVGGGA
jgi:hypothetical protein